MSESVRGKRKKDLMEMRMREGMKLEKRGREDELLTEDTKFIPAL